MTHANQSKPFMTAVLILVLSLLTMGMAQVARADTWSPADTMSTPPYGHTATLLSDGKVLVTGGYNDIVFLDSAEIYDPVTDSWSPADTMSTPRYGHTATLLSDGKVLVTGGYNDIVLLDSAEIYDPTTDTWSPADTMSTPRYGHTATLLSDDKVLVTGGYNDIVFLDSAEFYDPVTDSWSPATTPASRSFTVNAPVPDITVIARHLANQPPRLNFGGEKVGARTQYKDVEVHNDGTANLTIGTISLGGADANQFFLKAGKCTNKTLAPKGAHCEFDVRFQPTSTGAKTAYVIIPSNDPDENPVNVPLSGTGK